MMQDEKGRTAGNNVPMIYKALLSVHTGQSKHE